MNKNMTNEDMMKDVLNRDDLKSFRVLFDHLLEKEFKGSENPRLAAVRELLCISSKSCEKAPKKCFAEMSRDIFNINNLRDHPMQSFANGCYVGEWLFILKDEKKARAWMDQIVERCGEHKPRWKMSAIPEIPADDFVGKLTSLYFGKNACFSRKFSDRVLSGLCQKVGLEVIQACLRCGIGVHASQKDMSIFLAERAGELAGKTSKKEIKVTDQGTLMPSRDGIQPQAPVCWLDRGKGK